MGWVNVDGELGYILPGMDGVLFKDSIDPSHKIDPTLFHERLVSYGKMMRPAQGQEHSYAEAFLDSLTGLGPVMVPLIVQVLGGRCPRGGLGGFPHYCIYTVGPVRSDDVIATRPLLNRSVQLAQRGNDSIPETWRSTQNSLMRRLYEAKDITLLIDDYKKSAAGEPT